MKEVVKQKTLKNKKKAVQTCIVELKVLDKQICFFKG